MKIYKFTVTGHGPFPFDMLRYDKCYPDTSEDVVKMDKPTPRLGLDPRSVNMSSTAGAPTAERWSSFGWTVNALSARRI